MAWEAMICITPRMISCSAFIMSVVPSAAQRAAVLGSISLTHDLQVFSDFLEVECVRIEITRGMPAEGAVVLIERTGTSDNIVVEMVWLSRASHDAQQVRHHLAQHAWRKFVSTLFCAISASL